MTSMIYELHSILVRAAASLEVATVVVATAVVHIAILRAVHARELGAVPSRAHEIEGSYRRGRFVIGVGAGTLVCLATVFDIRGELFGIPSEGFRLSAAGFLFLGWALIAVVWLRTGSIAINRRRR
jgi:hypothetical protein